MKALSLRSISQRAVLLLVLAALLLCLVPLLLLGNYDVPFADDYNYGLDAHLAYVHSGSLLRALEAALRRTGDAYLTWQGSYAGVFLMCLQPAVFREGLYVLTPWLTLGALLGGLFCLCVALFRRLFDLPRVTGAIAAGIAGLLCLLFSPYPVESFYWFNGGVYYTGFFGCSLAFFALALRCARLGGAGRGILLGMLALFLGGGNLITGLSSSVIAVSVLALLFISGKKREAKRLLLPFLLLLLGFLLNVTAPGNAMRAAGIEHRPDALGAILGSFRLAAVFSLRWMRFPVLGALLFLGVLFWQVLPGSSFSFPFPPLVSLWSFCLYASMFCPAQYATGGQGAPRVLDVIYYAWILLLVLNLLYWLGWIRRRRPARADGPGLRLFPLLLAAAVWALALGASALLRGGLVPVAALSSLRSGQAAAYAAQAEERLAVLRDPEIRDPVFSPYSDPPWLLYSDDITPDPEDWRNQGMAVFYEKDSVILLPQD